MPDSHQTLGQELTLLILSSILKFFKAAGMEETLKGYRTYALTEFFIERCSIFFNILSHSFIEEASSGSLKKRLIAIKP